MDINSSGTGGAEDVNHKIVNDESEVADDQANLSGINDSVTQTPNRKNSKIGGSSGQIATKEHPTTDDTTEKGSEARNSSASIKKSMAKDGGSVDENGKRIRYDKFGNKITTTIGTFSVANRKNLIKNKKM